MDGFPSSIEGESLFLTKRGVRLGNGARDLREGVGVGVRVRVSKERRLEEGLLGEGRKRKRVEGLLVLIWDAIDDDGV